MKIILVLVMALLIAGCKNPGKKKQPLPRADQRPAAGRVEFPKPQAHKGPDCKT